MTEGEPIDSAEGSSPGGVEWSGEGEGWLRHWWRLDPKDPILIHRASGERIIHIEEMRDGSWHRFEFHHEDITYPLAVEVKRVWWPNPRAGRREGPRLDERAPGELCLLVWHVDHVRSLDLWRRREGTRAKAVQIPPYWLWRRVDHAIVDAALLWPRKPGSELVAARVVAVNGGWLNGAWREDFYRRIRRREDFGDSWEDIFRLRRRSHVRPFSIRELALPLSDHRLDEAGVPAPQWQRAIESGVDLCGLKTFSQTAMRNRLDGTVIVAASGSLTQAEQSPHPALVVLRDRTVWALPIRNNRPWGASGLPGELHPVFGVSSDLSVALDRPCSVLATSGNSKCLDVAWLPKPVAPFDGIGKAELPTYQTTVVNHPLSSYSSWRFLYDCLLNALPFSPGFDAEDLGSDVEQGENGQVTITGGFIGGIQGLVTEVRLKLELPSDATNAAWTKFFSRVSQVAESSPRTLK